LPLRPSAGLLVLTAVFAAQALAALYVGNRGWDDGTITLAFARTLSRTGRIALTPHSDIVEGYSSPAWLVAMALVDRAAMPGFDEFIRLSQMFASGFGALAAVVLFGMCQASIGTARAAALAVLVFVGGPFLNEAMNGMEMTLLALLVLLIARQLAGEGPLHGALVFVLAAAAAAVRFEAVLYLVVAAAVVYAATGDRSTALRLALGAVVGALVVESCRLLYFEQWLPNTILAKRWPPYRPVGVWPTLESHALALVEVVQAYGLPLAMTLVLIWRRSSFRAAVGCIRQRRELAFAFGYLGAVVAINAVIGKNWGYVGRMQLSAVPLIFVLAVGLSAPMAPRSRLYWPLVAWVAFVGSLSALQWDHVRYAIAARHESAAQTAAPHAQGGASTAVTPENYRRTGLAVDRLRESLGLATLSFMVPDIGGTSLCCERLAIIDSGLLADRTLAERGYGDFASYLERRQPDVVETHAFWAAPSAIYGSKFFRDRYSPVVVDRTWLYLRNDHVARLRSGGATQSRVGDPEHLKYRGNAFDEAFVAARGIVPLVLP
jgi:hypothetical protein